MTCLRHGVIKWIDAKLNFVLGVDKSKDNLENRINGACARYLDTHKVKHMPYAVFLNGTSEKILKWEGNV